MNQLLLSIKQVKESESEKRREEKKQLKVKLVKFLLLRFPMKSACRKENGTANVLSNASQGNCKLNILQLNFH